MVLLTRITVHGSTKKKWVESTMNRSIFGQNWTSLAHFFAPLASPSVLITRHNDRIDHLRIIKEPMIIWRGWSHWLSEDHVLFDAELVFFHSPAVFLWTENAPGVFLRSQLDLLPEKGADHRNLVNFEPHQVSCSLLGGDLIKPLHTWNPLLISLLSLLPHSLAQNLKKYFTSWIHCSHY